MMAHESHHQQQDKHGTLVSPCFGGYPDFSSSSNAAAIQSFQPGPELLGLQAGMEMLGMPSRHQRDNNNQNPSLWRSFKIGEFSEASNDNLMVTAEAASSSNPWQQPSRLMVDESTLRCFFPSEGSEQPSQGLSLSLCNPNTSDATGLPQSFHLPFNSRESPLAKSINLQQQQQFFLQDGRFFPSPPGLSQEPHMLRNSKYLLPAQELLNEFVNLGGGSSSKPKPKKSCQWDEGGPSSSSRNQSLYSLDLIELQKRKAKLLSMLEEVDRRYRKYCDQMRAVVSSFEAVAGEGAATVYSTLASKAMSRHFRCLRDGIVGEIQAMKKAMGEKDPVVPGTTRGETPRLRLLDQCLRQQKAFQQTGMMETHPWRPQRGLPERSVSVLRAWLFEHFLHPYPSDVDKHILAQQTGLSRSQVSNWFINARVRLWKPMVEEMYLEEIKEDKNQSSTPGNEEQNGWQGQLQPNVNTDTNPNPSASQLRAEDQKPTPGQLLHDSDSLSSIINTSHHRDLKDMMSIKDNQQQVPRTENFGVVDMDFSSYGNQGFGSSVSLTLGLEQHNGDGMSLSFSPASQHSLFFSREQIDDSQPVQFSILEGEAQNLPYRNLMGAQLLHDLAG